MHKKFLLKNKSEKGFSLVEAIIGTAVFVILALSVYQAFTTTMDVVRLSRVKITATALANEQFEIMRNLPYADIGIVGGLPRGKIPASQTLTRDGKEFTIKSTVRNIDDPFDGEIGEVPNDTSPADYKLAELEITCTACKNFPPLILTTNIAPKNLESSSTNGAIFIKVFDSSGQPISGVDVHLENNQVIPSFSIDDTTNNEGLLQIVDAPPGAQAYEVSVSKTGYTSDQTYAIGDPENPTPNTPHATVLAQQLTQISFVIDKLSTLNVESVSDTCQAIPDINFSLTGTKLIGTSPSVYKYNKSHSTDSDGEKAVDDLEWDAYNLTFSDTDYNLAGAIPETTFSLDPGSVQNLKLIVAPKSASSSLLVTVKDASTGLPLSTATVHLTGTDFDQTLTTGRGFIRQSDWSLGAGQTNFTDGKYFDSDSKIEIADPAGEIKLKKVLNEYETAGFIISSTFDTGSASNFHEISWLSQSQPPETGVNSVRLQIATNNDKSTWNFKGPDGTSNTYYTVGNQEINAVHDGDRYLRYKVFLQTADITRTPNISDILFTFTSDCVPPGQVYFTGLVNGNYNLTISKTGYEDYTGSTNIVSNWQQTAVTLSP